MTAGDATLGDADTAVGYRLHVNAITPAADNVRRDVGDVDDLVASITAHGILEPLLVTPKSKGGGFLLVAGHRRLAAAKAAGLDTVPCVVRADLTDADRVELMLIENLHRSDISPIEEAHAIRRLTGDLGVTQRALAKRIGRSQAHISKRLTLLQLPDEVLAKVGAPDGLTVGDALELAKVADDPAVVKKLAGDKEKWPHGVDMARQVKGELDKRAAAAKRAQVLADLEGQDVTVLDAPNAWGVYDTGHVPLAQSRFDITEDEHATMPCAAIVVVRDGTAVQVCTDPANHGDSAPPATPAAAKPDPVAKARGAVQEHLAEQASAAAELRDRLVAKPPAVGSALVDLVRALLAAQLDYEADGIADVLDIATSDDDTESDVADRVIAHLDGHPKDAVRVAVWLTHLLTAPSASAWSYGMSHGPNPAAVEHLAWRERRGGPPASDIERAVLAGDALGGLVPADEEVSGR
jgi:ParB family transcriptional regulator, chromosome partitioning protein